MQYDLFNKFIKYVETWDEVTVRQLRPGKDRYQIYVGAVMCFDGTKEKMIEYINLCTNIN